MGKKFSWVLVALFFAVLTTFAAVEGAEAFCIYNNADNETGALMWVGQESGSSFAKKFTGNISPGGNMCCNWQNKDCNKKGKRDSIVTFNVKRSDQVVGSVCENFPIQAGGSLTIEGNIKDGYKCVRHDY